MDTKKLYWLNDNYKRLLLNNRHMFYQLIFNTIFYDDREPEAATAVWRAPDDGHNNAQNMLSSVCATKQ